MLKVTIKSIELENFKGFYSAKIDFDEGKNVLYGNSGCGKSTIRDAWLWVCGLDVETPNPSIENKVIPNLETCVRCRISTNNGEYLISRKSKQKWKNVEGLGKVFNGFDASNFTFDGVPMSATTYRDKICTTFNIPKYEYLKFLCDSNYFNNDKGEWNYKKRREILFKIGNIQEKIDELNNLPEYELIKADLDKGLTTAEITKALNSSDRTLSETKKANLTRITERANDLNIDYDFEALREELKINETLYREKSNELKSLSNESDIIAIEKQIAEKQNLIDRLMLVDEQEKNRLEQEKQILEYEISNLKRELSYKQSEISNLKSKKETVQNSKYTVSICPVCKQEIKTSVSKEDAIKEFNKHKKEAISKLNEEIETATNNFEEDKTKLENMLVKLNSYNDIKVEENTKISVLKTEIEKLEIEKEEKTQSKNDTQLKLELQSIEDTIRDISNKLAFEKIKESADNRIKQLEKDNLEIAKMERANNLKRQCNENYLISIVKLSNDSINSKFNKITWNLFDTYNADAEKSYKEECEVMLNNKLYSQCSTGERLITDFYTVIGLQKAFNVSLPIFFDEAQSSTFKRTCEQQLIELETSSKETNINGVRINLKGDK